MYRHIMIAFVAGTATACGGSDRPSEEPAPPSSPDATGRAKAAAAIYDAGGRLLGTVRVSDDDGGVTVVGELRGLAPGEHGFHVHETGLCEAPFASAGGHWNPLEKQHGTENPAGHHMGDMKNLIVSADSAVLVWDMIMSAMLDGPGGMLDSDGAALVIHEGPDDNVTDPAGNSGARIACGVVVRAD